jgi:hypothetical protein
MSLLSQLWSPSPSAPQFASHVATGIGAPFLICGPRGGAQLALHVGGQFVHPPTILGLGASDAGVGGRDGVGGGGGVGGTGVGGGVGCGGGVGGVGGCQGVGAGVGGVGSGVGCTQGVGTTGVGGVGAGGGVGGVGAGRGVGAPQLPAPGLLGRHEPLLQAHEPQQLASSEHAFQAWAQACVRAASDRNIASVRSISAWFEAGLICI